MGSGRWDANTYASTTSTRAFNYHAATASAPQTQWKAHADLDPKDVKFRESRDSTEHPTSLAIGIMLDVTGSMSVIPRALQAELPKLLGHLQQNDYVEHPQILFGGIGDATCDRVPLQVGQFESDNRMDDCLGNLFLEGGGGGQNTESYELALYFMARHTEIDCFDRRGEKGFLFIVGDELPYPEVKQSEVDSVIGGGFQGPVAFGDILKEVQAKYEVYYILPKGTSHADDPTVRGFWEKAVGKDRVLPLDKPEDICETIGVAIASQAAISNLTSVVSKSKTKTDTSV